MSAISSFVEHYWWATFLGIAFLVWAVRAARRAKQLASAAAFEPRPRDTRDPSSTAPFRRSDFAGKAETVRRRMVRGVPVGLAIFLVSFPVLFAVVAFAPSLLSGSSFTVAILAVWAVVIAVMVAFEIRGTRQMRRIGLLCPACRTGLVGPRGEGEWTQDLVLESGKCPQCGAQLLDPAEVGPVSHTLTSRDHVRGIASITALLAGIGAVAYFGNAAITARRAANCHRRYAAAQNPADSAAVDARRLSKRGTVTCGDMRRAGKLGG